MGWCSAIPAFPDLRFSRDEFRDAIRVTLGMRTAAEIGVRGLHCACGVSACPSTGPSHVGNCHRNSGFRSMRHNLVQDCLKLICKSAGLRPILEHPVGQGNNRTDVTIHNVLIPEEQSDGTVTITRKEIHVDTAVAEAASASGIAAGAAEKRGIRAKIVARKKNLTYSTLMPAGAIFLSAVIETQGFMHSEFRRFIHILAAHVTHTSVTDNDISATDADLLKGIHISRFYQLISVATKKAVLHCISKACQKIRNANYSSQIADAAGRRFRASLSIGAAQRNANAGPLYIE